MISPPLYGMISDDGDTYTMVFHPEHDPVSGRRRHVEMSRSDASVFEGFVGSGIPVIDLQPTTSKLPFFGVREEHAEQRCMFGVESPTLDQFCEHAKRAGAAVWSLTNENWLEFLTHGRSPGVTPVMMAPSLGTQRMMPRLSPVDIDPAPNIRRDIATNGLRLGRRNLTPGAFLGSYLRTAENRAFVATEKLRSGTLDSVDERRNAETIVRDADSLQQLFEQLKPEQFESAICSAMADRFEMSARPDAAGYHDEAWFTFARALGVNLDDKTSGGANVTAAALRLRTMAMLAFQDHVELSYGVRTWDFRSWGRSAGLPSVLRNRAVALSVGEEPPRTEGFIGPSTATELGMTNFAAQARAVLGDSAEIV